MQHETLDKGKQDSNAYHDGRGSEERCATIPNQGPSGTSDEWEEPRKPAGPSRVPLMS